MQTEKFQPEGKRIMPETRFTEFPAFSVDPKVEISWSASETDVQFLFLPMTSKIVIYYLSFLSFSTLRRTTSFSEHRLVIFVVVQKLRHF